MVIISILKWLALVPAAQFANLVGYLAAPFVALFSYPVDWLPKWLSWLRPAFATTSGWLPKWLSWFQTPDYSLDGDYGWMFEHWQWEWRDKIPRWLDEYVGRVGWLGRNTVYGFDIDVLGCKAQPGYSMTISGDIRVSNRPLVEGLVIRTITNPDGTVYWQLYYVKVRNEKYCLRINLGWKLWNIKDGVSNQMVVSINPWMGYMKAKL